MKGEVPSLNLVSHILLTTRYQALLYEPSTRRTERDRRAILDKMPSRALNDLIIALLHEVVGPRHHRRGRCGG
jgi:hypothetical protein